MEQTRGYFLSQGVVMGSRDFISDNMVAFIFLALVFNSLQSSSYYRLFCLKYLGREFDFAATTVVNEVLRIHVVGLKLYLELSIVHR